MRLVLSFGLFLLSMACDAKDRLPDTLLTLDKVYYYCIAKPETSLTIIETMRERQMAPEWQLDMAEADVNYGMRRYLRALSIYQKIDESGVVKDSTHVQLLLLKWQMDCYVALLIDDDLAQSILRLRKKAKDCGDKAFEAMYNPQNDFSGHPKTKRANFRAKKKNESVLETSNTQAKIKH